MSHPHWEPKNECTEKHWICTLIFHSTRSDLMMKKKGSYSILPLKSLGICSPVHRTSLADSNWR